MEPEQGVPRYVTVEREEHSDYMVRRGLALMVNHGFAATPGGQRDFMYKVATIAGAVQETCDQSGVMALLRSKNTYRSYITDMVRNSNDAYDMFQHELWKWGIIQHSERGWYHMDAEAESVLQTSNIEPDTWIVPGRMRSYVAMGQHAETEVYRAGEKTARGNLELGKKNFSSFRGKKVFEVRPYQLDVDGRTVDPLNRTRMIGDFFIVPYYEACYHREGLFLPKRGSTQVYCCETDRFEKFTWSDMKGHYCDTKATFSGGDELRDLFFPSRHQPDPSQDRHGQVATPHVYNAQNFPSPPRDTTAPLQLSRRTGEAMEMALDKAITSKYGTDPNCEKSAAATWANVYSSLGVCGTQARDLTKDAMMHACTERIVKFSGETLAELNDEIHKDSNGNQFQLQHVADELYDAYLNNDLTGGGFDSVECDATHAIKAKMASKATAMGPLTDPWRENLCILPWKYGNEVGVGSTGPAHENSAVRDAAFKAGENTIQPYLTFSDLDGLYSQYLDGIGRFKGQYPHEVIGKLNLCTCEGVEACINAVYCDGNDAKIILGRLHQESLAGLDFIEVLIEMIKKGDVEKYNSLATGLYEDEKGATGAPAVRTDLTDAQISTNFVISVMSLIYQVAMKAQAANSDIVCDWLCVRPFREYTMGSGILLKKGSELGNTFRGWADFQLTDNIIAKTHIGHFTFWHASIVTNPKCLFLAEDIFCTNYLRGEGKKCLPWKNAKSFKDDPMGTMQTTDSSIICLPIPLGAMDPSSHRLNMPNPVALSGNLDVYQAAWGGNNRGVDVSMAPSNCVPDYLKTETQDPLPQFLNMDPRQHNGFLPCILAAYSGKGGGVTPQVKDQLQEYFNGTWGFNTLNNQVDIDGATTFETSGNLINTVCFHTMQKFRNPCNNRWEVTNLNTGHFGENGIYEGVKKIRCGFIDYFKEMDYQKSMAMGGMTI